LKDDEFREQSVPSRGNMYAKVLVPLDGSELAACVLEHLKKVVSKDGASEVILIRVVEPISSFELASWSQGGYTSKDIENMNMENAKAYLSLAAEKLRNQGISSQTKVIFGIPAESILEYAEKNYVDLIIISTHGRSGIVRWAFGSVANKIAHQSQIPVLLITPRDCRSPVS
jgi:nucleotide-binding universal stress UspA family protein